MNYLVAIELRLPETHVVPRRNSVFIGGDKLIEAVNLSLDELVPNRCRHGRRCLGARGKEDRGNDNAKTNNYALHWDTPLDRRFRMALRLFLVPQVLLFERLSGNNSGVATGYN